MRTVEVQARVTGIPCQELYQVVKDFAKYPELTEDVRKVEVEPIDDRSARSRWEVTFQDGLLRWVEQDEFFDAERKIVFAELEGDMASFEGVWRILDGPDGGATVQFAAQFDLGMASLGTLVEPVAERVLRENIVRILDGLTGGRASVLEDGTERGSRRPPWDGMGGGEARERVLR